MEAHSIHGRIYAHQPLSDAAQESGAIEMQYNLPLYHAATRGDFQSAKNFVGDETNLWTARITDFGDTILMVAARAFQWQFVEKLLEILPPEALAMQDRSGNTVLQRVVTRGSVKTAKALIRKNGALTQITDERGCTSLVSSTHRPGNKEMVWYLTLVTKPEYPSPSCPFTGTQSGKLLRLLTAGGYNDVTLHLLRRYPCLALPDDNGRNLLQYLSENPSQFFSGSELSVWKRWIYIFVPAGTEYANTAGRAKMHTPIQYSLRRFILQVLGVEQVREAKLQHVCAIEIVKLVFEQLGSKMNNQQAQSYLKDVLYAATSSGNVEIVTTCLEHYPGMMWFPISGDKKNILYVAVKYRQHKIFNLISQMRTFTPAMAHSKDESGNTIWHLSSKLAHAQLLSVSGAALKMQREMQWFKEVEKLIRPADKNKRNSEGKTAEEVFREEHSKLAEKGEEWMKDTANSCMIVATLIATVMFAAAFTVPGGNISDKGIPIFLGDNLFMVFAISDALALFSSCTSLLMFLAILTARYEPKDFLLALPKRLIIGLGSLFLSIITMMVAFGATLFIVLGERWEWVFIPIILLAAIPIITFGMLQLPLFIQIVQSTYGSGIFVKTNW